MTYSIETSEREGFEPRMLRLPVREMREEPAPMSNTTKAEQLAERIHPQTDWYEFDQQTWCNEAAAELRRLSAVEADKERTERNRDMWKAQCERQSAVIGELRGAGPLINTTPTEVELVERAALRAGMKSLINHGAASCVYSEGCAGVTQEHLIAFAREIALHCATALSAIDEWEKSK